jgi:hypothetical protein
MSKVFCYNDGVDHSSTMIKESLLRVDNVDGNIVDFLMTVPKRKREDDENAWSSSSFNQHDDNADADDCKYTNTFISNKRFAFYSCDTELREEGSIIDCVVSPTALVSIFRQTTSPQSTTISLESNNNESNDDDSSSSSGHPPEFSTIARARTISETDSNEEYEKLYFSNDPPDMNSISSRPTSPLLDEPRQLQLVY